MFETISDFIDGISAFTFNMPLWLQIVIIIIVIIVISAGAFFSREYFDTTYMRSGIMWFIFIAILNLSTILVIFIYYNKKTNAIDAKIPDGKPGIPGKKGKRGKKGNYINCSYCKNNVYIQKVRKSDVICTLSTYTEEFVKILTDADYFKAIIEKGNSIDYSSFINGIILRKTVIPDKPQKTLSATATESINKFRNLMKPNAIAILLIKILNYTITRASDKTYGTFRNPRGKIGYLPIGDCVYGGLENFELNSFMLNGDVLYPPKYTKLVSFTSYNENTKDIDTYSIWRPNDQTVGVDNYKSLGDVCRYGTEQPKVNQIVTIKESCIDKVKSEELQLVYIYAGPLNYNDDVNNLDYTKTNSYLITNKAANNIEIFSVWRTPLNTFITNCKQTNNIVNNTFIYNMYNNAHDALNEYNTISNDSKIKASNLLQSINIPKILIASIICKHYEIELRKELVYYFNYYQSKIPEFKTKSPMVIPEPPKINTPVTTKYTKIKYLKPETQSPVALLNPNELTFGDLMDKIQNTIDGYDAYNQFLVKKASLNLSDSNYISYDEANEKHFPKKLLSIYNRINDSLLTISVEIENANTLLDIINIIFDSGIETRIATNADGIAEGGILLNEIQETILMLCKILMPPTQSAYTIKDDCLGTFAIDRDREKIIKEFTKIKTQYYDLNDEMSLDPDKYKKIALAIKQYNDLLTAQIGQLCSHISNYTVKLDDMNLEEFTTSRIKSMIQYYTNIIKAIINAMNTV